MKKKIKYIKIKRGQKSLMSIALQEWVLKMTNAGMISRKLHWHCRSFVEGLSKIELSEEYQNNH